MLTKVAERCKTGWQIETVHPLRRTERMHAWQLYNIHYRNLQLTLLIRQSHTPTALGDIPCDIYVLHGHESLARLTWLRESIHI